MYTFSERLKFEVFKTKKVSLKNSIEEKTGNLKIKNLKLLKESLSYYYTNFLNFFFNKCVTLSSRKISSENFFNDILDERWPKMSILVFFLQNCQVLSSPTVWEYMYKMLLKNIETEKEIMGLYKLSFWSFLIEIFFNNALKKWIITVDLCVTFWCWQVIYRKV